MAKKSTPARKTKVVALREEYEDGSSPWNSGCRVPRSQIVRRRVSGKNISEHFYEDTKQITSLSKYDAGLMLNFVRLHPKYCGYRKKEKRDGTWNGRAHN